MHAFKLVSMIASNTFQKVSSKPILRLSMFIFGMKTRIFHPRSIGISPCCHMHYVKSTRFLHLYGFGWLDVPSAGYASLSHFLKRSALRCVWTPDLFRHYWRTSASTSAYTSVGTSFLILNGVMWFWTVLPGGFGSTRQKIAAYSSVSFDISACKGWGALADTRQYQLLRMV